MINNFNEQYRNPDIIDELKFIKRVDTYDESKEWINKSKSNEVRKNFIDISKIETDEQKEERLTRVRKREECRKAKRNAAAG